MSRARTCVALLCCFAATACFTERKEQRVQPITVITDPAGAEVWTVGPSGRAKRGVSPAVVDAPYEVTVQEPTGACWITPVIGAASTIGGIYAFTTVDPAATDGSIGGILGGTFATSIGVALMTAGFACAMDPVETPGKPSLLTIGATSAGHEERSLQLPIPGPTAELQLVLPAGGSGGLVALGGIVGGAVEAKADAFLPGAPQPAAFALVIGIERYRDVPPTPGARRDAERFAALARTTLGVPERNVRLLLDDRATRSDVEKELAFLASNVPAGGRIYLFFAGHGAPDPSTGTPFLVPYDGDPAYLDRTALPVQAITEALAKTRARDVIGFVDACFSGSGGRSILPKGARPLVPVMESGLPGKVALLSAAGGKELTGATTTGDSGLFSSHLLEALGHGRADLDGDGQLSLQELTDWLGPRVERDARRENRDQHPQLRVGGALGPAKALTIAFDVHAP